VGSGAAAGAAPAAGRPLLDRWLLSELHANHPGGHGRPGGFRHRRRGPAPGRLHRRPVELVRPPFRGGSGKDPVRRTASSAFATLYESLHVLTRLMAPSRRSWPIMCGPCCVAGRPGIGTPGQLASRGRGAHRLPPVRADGTDQAAGGTRAVGRAAASVPVRQPLPRAVVSAAGFGELAPELRAEVTRELNVRALEPWPRSVKTWSITWSSRTSGPWAAGLEGTQAVAAAITAAEPVMLAPS